MFLTLPSTYSFRRSCYLLLYAWCLFHNGAVSAQCVAMDWMDDELNRRSGSYRFTSFPDAKYSYGYYHRDCSIHGVTKRTVFNAAGIKRDEQEFDSSGFLTAEIKHISGGYEFHRYCYQNDRQTVIDTITRISVRYGSDPLAGSLAEPLRTDTAYGIEKRMFDKNKQLRAIYNLRTRGKASRGKLTPSYGDSLFYHYDACGNCHAATWYVAGKRSEVSYRFDPPQKTNNGRYTVYVSHLDPGPVKVVANGLYDTRPEICNGNDPYFIPDKEEWTFNADHSLCMLDAGSDLIIIKYAGNRVESYTHWMTEGDGKKINQTRTFTYDSAGDLVAVRIKWSDMAGDGDLVQLGRYQNGLSKNDLRGNTIRYTYRQ